MERDDSLFLSIFVVFFGFLIFMSSIINKKFLFLKILDTYFILFLFFGVVSSLIGVFMMIVWHVNNRMPFQEKVVKNHFPTYLGFGAYLIIVGFTIIFYYSNLSKFMYLMSIALSIAGIIFLILGLRYYIKEVMVKTKQPSNRAVRPAEI